MKRKIQTREKTAAVRCLAASGGGPEVNVHVQLSQESKEGDSRQYRPQPSPCGNKVYRWPMEKRKYTRNVHWNWKLGTPIAPSGESQQQKTTNTTRDARIPLAGVCEVAIRRARS